jgi:YD repeat-containing protein
MTTYADGKSTTQVRNTLTGLVERFVNEREFSTFYRYDAQGNMIGVSLPDGGRSAFEYDPGYGVVLWSADSYGRKTVYGYDAQKNLTSVTDRLGNVTGYQYYDAAGAKRGLVEWVLDPRDPTVKTKYEYDDARRLIRTTDPYGEKTTYSYVGANGYGNVTEVVDPLARETTTQYDGLNRVRVVADVFNATNAWAYDAQGRVLTATDAHEVTAVSAYDSRGLLTQVTEAAGTSLARTTHFHHDKSGNRDEEWRARDYDTPSALAGTDEPYWSRTVTGYDNRNRAITVTDGASYTVEELNKQTGQQGPEFKSDFARTTMMKYDDAGNLTGVGSRQAYDKVAGAKWIWSEYEYDNLGRVRATTLGGEWTYGIQWTRDTLGRKSTSRYDLNGNANWVQTPDGVVTATAYDALDRPIATAEAVGTPQARVSEVGYDKAGNIAWTTEALPSDVWVAVRWVGGSGIKTAFGYDKLNRLISTTEALGTAAQRTSLTEYDTVGRVVWEYEPLAYGTTEYNPAQFTHVGTQYLYDDATRTVTRVEAANVAPGQAVADRTAFAHVRPTTVTAYDKLGRATVVTETVDEATSRATRYEYDDLGRKSKTYQNWKSASEYDRVTEWKYDAANNVRSEERAGKLSNATEVPAQQWVTDSFGYDVHDRLVWVKQASDFTRTGQPVDYPYAPQSSPKTSYKYDARDNLLLVTDPRVSLTEYTYTRFDEVEWTREGGKLNENYLPTDFLRETKTEYDSAGRLWKVTRKAFVADDQGKPVDAVTQYGHDALGRRTSVTEGLNTSLRRTTNYAYDANDRLIRVTDPLWIPGGPTIVGGFVIPFTQRTTVYGYDALGRQTAVTEAAGSTGFSRTTTRGYDASDNMVWEATPRAYDYTPTPSWLFGWSSIDPADATVTAHKYDALDRRTRTTAAANASALELGHRPPEARWTYDALGRVVIEESPVAVTAEGVAFGTTPIVSQHRRAVEYKYDLLDQVTQITEGTTAAKSGDLPPTFSGVRKTTIGYDGAGNEVERKTGQPVSTASGAGADRWGQTKFRYDALGRLRETYEWLDDTYKRLSIATYDATGNVISTTVRRQDDESFGNTRVTKVEYDRLDRTRAVYQAWADNQDQVSQNLTGKTIEQGGYGSPITKYEYDAGDHVTKVTDPRGVETTARYDVLGRKVEETQGGYTTLAPGVITSDFVPLEQTFAYDAGDRLRGVGTKNLWVVDSGSPDGASLVQVWTQFEYDAHDRMTKQIDAAGTNRERHTITGYDAIGNVLTLTIGASPIATLTIDGRTLPYSNPVATGFEYDALGRLRRVKAGPDPTSDSILAEYGHSQPWTEFVYDGLGNKIAVRTNVSTSVGGKKVSVSRFTYEDGKLFRLVETSEGESESGDKSQARRTVYGYDSADNVVSVKVRGNPEVTYAYDRVGNRTQEQIAGTVPLTTKYEYNVFGEVKWIATPVEAKADEMEYDLLGRVKVHYRHAKWEQIAYSYDENGNTLKTKQTVYPYWYHNNEIIFNEGKTVQRHTTTSAQYDPLGRKVVDTDAYGHSTWYMYDPLGRVEAVWSRDGKIRWLGYDAAGRQTYESWLPSPTETRPVGGQAITDATVIVTYADAADRLTYSFQGKTTLKTQETQDEDRFVFGSPAPNSTWADVTDATRTRIEYDRLGRVKSETAGSGTALTLNYKYDAAGRAVTVSDAQGGKQTTNYDLAGRVISRGLSGPDGKGAYFTFEYVQEADWRSDRTRKIEGRNGTSESGVVTIRADIEYDNFGREKSRGWHNPQLPGSGDKELVKTAYTLQGLVFLETRGGTVDPEQLQTWLNIGSLFTYDAFGQVRTQADTTSWDSATGWFKLLQDTPRDASGNGPYKDLTYAMKTGHRTTFQGISVGESHGIVYDNGIEGEASQTGTEGNVGFIRHTINSKGQREEYQYQFDHRNRLTTAVKAEFAKGGPNPTKQTTAQYIYDVFDRLVERTLPPVGAPARYVYVGEQPYGDTDTDGKYRLRYLFGPDGQPLARLDSKETLFYLTDRQNSVLQIVDTNGAPRKRIKYEGLKASDGGYTLENPQNAPNDRFALGGQMLDEAVGLSRLNGQWYDPGLGRFLTEGGPGIGLNPYPVADNSSPNSGQFGPAPDKPFGDDEVYGENAARFGLAVSDAWEKPRSFGVNIVNKITFGGLSQIYNPHRTREEQAAYNAGEIPGTILSMALGYGLVARGIGWGVKAAGWVGKGGQLSGKAGLVIGGGTGAAFGAGGYHLQTAGNPSSRTLGGYLGAAFGGLLGGAAGSRLGTGWAASIAGGAGVGAVSSLAGNAVDQALRSGPWDWSEFGMAGLGGVLGGGIGGGVFRGLAPRLGLGVARNGNTAARASEAQYACDLARRGVASFALRHGFVGGLGGMMGDAATQGVALLRGWQEGGFDWGRFWGAGLAGAYAGAGNYAAMRAAMKVCFTGEMPMRTVWGSVPARDVRKGDKLLSRDENNEDGLIVAQEVEEVFVREGLISHLDLPNGVRIRTTNEHPFYVKGKGWLPLSEIRAGDEIRLEEPGWVTVKGVEHTGQWETVYNFRIKDFHTYFVGCDEWGFSVWAHNTDCANPNYRVERRGDHIYLVQHRGNGDWGVVESKGGRTTSVRGDTEAEVFARARREGFLIDDVPPQLQPTSPNPFPHLPGYRPRNPLDPFGDARDWYSVAEGRHGAPPSVMERPHGHHTVPRRPGGAAALEIEHAQQILWKWGIDPIHDFEVVHWAPLGAEGVHGAEAARFVYKRVLAADAEFTANGLTVRSARGQMEGVLAKANSDLLDLLGHPH